MPIQKQCEIREMKPLTADIFSMVLDAGEMASAAQPGQFVHIRCGEGHLLRRPISICDAWEDNLRIVFQVRGTGTDWLAKRTVGERLDVLGPLGNGFDLSGDKPILLVGGGILIFAGGGKKKKTASLKKNDKAEEKTEEKTEETETEPHEDTK